MCLSIRNPFGHGPHLGFSQGKIVGSSATEVFDVIVIVIVVDAHSPARPPAVAVGKRDFLLPSTVPGIAQILGIGDRLRATGFTVTNGGTFRWGINPVSWMFSFAVSPTLAGPSSSAYQLERMKFDQILLDSRREHGVDLRESCAVLEVSCTTHLGITIGKPAP
jgi:hypothetical protein